MTTADNRGTRERNDGAAREAIRRASMEGKRLVHGGVAVIVPTVPGREADLERTTRAYEAEPHVYVLPQYGHKAVGAGWRAGVEAVLERPQAERPEFVMLGNDDMPPLPGWLMPAIQTIDDGFTPCPVLWSEKDGLLGLESAGRWGVYTSEGAIVGWAPMTMFRLAEWHLLGEMPPIHYWSDNWFSDASALRLGRPLRVTRGFQFTHTWAEPGRRSMDTPEGREHNRLYRQAHAEMIREPRAPRVLPVDRPEHSEPDE